MSSIPRWNRNFDRKWELVSCVYHKRMLQTQMFARFVEMCTFPESTSFPITHTAALGALSVLRLQVDIR